MNEQKEIVRGPVTDFLSPGYPANRARLRTWTIASAILVLAFAKPLYELVRFSLESSLFSHIVLIPFVSGYLVWISRQRVQFATDPIAAAAPTLAGVLALAGFWYVGPSTLHTTSLPLAVLALVLLFIGLTAGLLGRAALRAFAFPLAFLVFMIPWPAPVVDAIETFLQHGSASVAAAMFRVATTPLLRDNLIFQLPGITLEVAPECSGIRSSVALFITSLVAGQLFLRSNWKRAVLSFAVIPLALLRNGFRVFTIGELCVHISPDMIHSYIHRQGGPIFFALSLVPFGLLLLLLMKLERQAPAAPTSTSVLP